MAPSALESRICSSVSSLKDTTHEEGAQVKTREWSILGTGSRESINPPYQPSPRHIHEREREKGRGEERKGKTWDDWILWSGVEDR